MVGFSEWLPGCSHGCDWFLTHCCEVCFQKNENNNLRNYFDIITVSLLVLKNGWKSRKLIMIILFYWQTFNIKKYKSACRFVKNK